VKNPCEGSSKATGKEAWLLFVKMKKINTDTRDVIIISYDKFGSVINSEEDEERIAELQKNRVGFTGK
jgi:hypothetical protein